MTDEDELPAPGPSEVTASLNGWEFDVREGWASGKTTPPSLVSPSGNGVVQMSFYDVNPLVTSDFLAISAKTTLESAGVRNPLLGDPLTVPSGEQFVGGRGRMTDGLLITAMAGGKGHSVVVMTFIHDGQDAQEQADAEATLVSARLAVPGTDGGIFKKLFHRN
jgi:hypothetical protein